MTSPIFISPTPELRGSIIAIPAGGYLVSVHHEPTGQTLYGRERTYDHAVSWIECSQLIFCEAGGRA
jgi:hypothetical protein